MKNCFLKSFRGTVNNGNLPIYNHLKVVAEASSVNFAFNIPSGATISWDNNTDSISINGTVTTSPYISPSRETYTITGTLTRETTFFISNAKEIWNIYFGSGTYKELEKWYKELIMKIPLKKMEQLIRSSNLFDEYNLNEFNFDALTMLEISTNKKVVFNINRFSEKTDMTKMSLYTNSSSNVTGSINNLKKNLSMTRIDVRNCSSVTGDVETISSYMSNQGRTSGNLELQLADAAVTFNSQIQNVTLKVVFSNSGCDVKVASSNVIIGTYTKANDTWTYMN